jgi:tetratricopeptide (TPR) repeat protein
MKRFHLRVWGLAAAAVVLLAGTGLPARAGDPPPPADPLAGIGELLFSGKAAEAQTRLGDALLRYKQQNDPEGQALCHLLLGMAYVAKKDVPAARSELELGASQLGLTGDRFGSWLAFWMLGELEKNEGRFEASIAHYDRSLTALREAESSSEPFSLAGLEQLAVVFGLPADALGPLLKQPEIVKPLLLRLALMIAKDGRGGVLVEAGRLGEAETDLAQAAELSRLFGGLFDASVAAHVGDLRRRQWRLDEARESYEKALAGVKKLPAMTFRDEWVEVRILGELAEIEQLSGSLDAALAWNDKALALVRLRGNPKREASLLQDRANFLLNHQRLDGAEATFAQALELAKKSGDTYLQATIFADLGFKEMLAGRYEKSVQNLETAVRLFRDLHETYVEASVWTLLADAYLLLDDHANAAAATEKARALAKKSEFHLAEAMAGLITAADRHAAGQGTASEIAQSFESFLKVPEAGGLMFNDPTVALFREMLPREKGDESRVLQPVQNPEAIAKIGLPQLPAMARFVLGKLRFESGEYAAARDLWRQALAENPNRDLRAGLLAAIGATYVKEGQPEESLGYFTQAVDGVEHSGIQVEELLAGYLGAERRIYSEIVVDALARQGRVQEAFVYAERARARAFLQLLGNRRLQPAAGSDPQLAREAEALRTEILFLERQSLVAPPQEQKARHLDLENARLRYQALLVRLKVLNPEYASVTQVETVKVEDLQREIPPDATLVSYFVSPFGAQAWVLDRETFQHVSLALRRADLSRAVCWADQVARRKPENGSGRGAAILDPSCAEGTATAEELYAQLIAPLRKHIRHSRLILVPHGALHYLPFAALRDPQTQEYLVQQFTLTYLPSASVLRFLRGKEAAVTGKALVLGNPTSTLPNLPPLPFAEREATAVAHLFGVAPVLGSQATETPSHRRARLLRAGESPLQPRRPRPGPGRSGARRQHGGA